MWMAATYCTFRWGAGIRSIRWWCWRRLESVFLAQAPADQVAERERHVAGHEIRIVGPTPGEPSDAQVFEIAQHAFAPGDIAGPASELPGDHRHALGRVSEGQGTVIALDSVNVGRVDDVGRVDWDGTQIVSPVEAADDDKRLGIGPANGGGQCRGPGIPVGRGHLPI